MDDTPRARLQSLDVIRGAVCILMAIDHVRVYAGVPAGGPDPAVFFTRWVTHFVAPIFCFLAGTGAYLHGRKLGDTRALARFLASRGLVLVVLELTVIRFMWTFNFDYAHLTLAGVIWMLGWCMVMLAALVRFSPRTVAMVGGAIVLFQQLLGFLPRLLPVAAWKVIGPVYALFYAGSGPAPVQPLFGMAVLFVLVPWIGVMALGYGFGPVMEFDAARRRRIALRTGWTATLAFIILAITVALMHKRLGPVGLVAAPNDTSPLWQRVLNQQKYPASQLFLLMTLGPMFLLLPSAERARGWLANALATFGRVPMWYYLLHIPVIHLVATLVAMVRTPGVSLVGNFPLAPPELPPTYRWSLWLLYFVLADCIILLYPACRWYAARKAQRRAAWMSYI